MHSIDLKQDGVLRDVGHGVGPMDILDDAFGVDHGHERHAPQLEQVDLLPVETGDLMIWIRDPDEWNALRAPIPAKFAGAVRANGDHFYPAAGELRVIVSQTRQLRAAVRSGKAAQESQQDEAPAKILQADKPAVRVSAPRSPGQVPAVSSALASWANSTARCHMPSNMAGVSLPVSVFCWLG